MSKAALFSKMLQVFVLARRVNHYYWLHTDAHGAQEAVSVENLQRIIERLAQLRIRKFLVDFDGSSLRGNVERYDDHVDIHVRKSLSDAWQRFTVVKELCHILLDEEEDWSVDVVNTISDLLSFSGFSGEESAEIRSEKLAEVMALELAYPIADRRPDLVKIASGAKTSEIAASRKIPAIWVERALNEEYLTACEDTWKALASVPDEHNGLPTELA